MLLTKMLGGVSLVLGVLLTVVYLMWQSEMEARVLAQGQVKQLNSTIEYQRKEFEKQKEIAQTLNNDMTALRIERDTVVNKLNEYRNREKIVLEKPKSVERLANAATKRLFNDIYTESGGSVKTDTTEARTDNTDNN